MPPRNFRVCLGGQQEFESFRDGAHRRLGTRSNEALPQTDDACELRGGGVPCQGEPCNLRVREGLLWLRSRVHDELRPDLRWSRISHGPYYSFNFCNRPPDPPSFLQELLGCSSPVKHFCARSYKSLYLPEYSGFRLRALDPTRLRVGSFVRLRNRGVYGVCMQFAN